MPKKTFGYGGTEPKKTRDYTSDFAPGATQGGEAGSSRKAKGNDARYHVHGRPWTRSGQETDKRA